MAGRSRSRQRVCWSLFSCAILIATGTLYLIFSPDPPSNDEDGRRREEIFDSDGGVVSGSECDDPEWGVHRLAVLVPFRDRLDELVEFAPHIHRFLCQQRVRHKVFVINQADPFRFNRGALINVGFLVSENSSFDYIAVHDVDLIPLNHDLSYMYPVDGPFHVSSPELHPRYHYQRFLGGILLMTNEHFRQVRGFSNNFWGWGREDDEFYKRIEEEGLKISRPEGITTGNRTFRHLHDNMRRPRDGHRYGDQRAYLRRDRNSGIDTIQYTVLSVHQLRIDHSADVTIINVQLQCILELTPWCLAPRQLVAALKAERARLSAEEFARLEDNLRRHGFVYDLQNGTNV